MYTYMWYTYTGRDMIYIYIYIYTVMIDCIRCMSGGTGRMRPGQEPRNLGLGGFDSGSFLNSRGGIPRSVGILFPEI